MEEKISKWATKIVGGSYVATVLVIALIWLVVSLVNGQTDILFSATTHKFAVTGIIYIVSIYLVGTLPGKIHLRRLCSWLFSLMFHAGLLLYIAFALDAGGVALIVGMVETIILALSLLGLVACVYSKYQENA